MSRRASTMHITVLFVVVFFCQTGFAGLRVAVLSGPDGWKAEAPREEISPQFRAEQREKGGHELVMAARGTPATSGWWTKDFEIASGTWHLFQAKYKAKNVTLPRRSVLVRLVRYDNKGKRGLRVEYPPTQAANKADGWHIIAGKYDMPDECVKVRVELLLRWTTSGEVRWRDIKLTPTEPLEPRMVRVATVYDRPAKRTKGPEENLNFFAEVIDKAAMHKPDIICLGEGITVVSTGKSYVDVAETIPGPSTRLLGWLSKKYDCYIVAGLYERDGEKVFNTSVLTGPDGELVGKYRKTCLPREEIEGGIMPGHEYPVFDTRFGKVGMMICWDLAFPEVARRLANRGAEIIFAPIWGGIDTLARARAIENQVYLVTSTYNSGTKIRVPTVIYDRSGDALAVAMKDHSIVVADIDLNKRTQLRGYESLGDLRARIPRERPRSETELLTVD